MQVEEENKNEVDQSSISSPLFPNPVDIVIEERSCSKHLRERSRTLYGETASGQSSNADRQCLSLPKTRPVPEKYGVERSRARALESLKRLREVYDPADAA